MTIDKLVDAEMDELERLAFHVPVGLQSYVRSALSRIASAAHQRGAAQERRDIVSYLEQQAERLRTEPPIMAKEARVLMTTAAAIRATREGA